MALNQTHAEHLAGEIKRYLKKNVGKKPHALTLPEQPFDSYYLKLSPLYRKSREVFYQTDGVFKPELLTAPRSLGSDSLLDECVSYSPIESEMLWSASGPVQSKKPEHLFQLATFTTSIFHEQNHRILWKMLPKPKDRSKEGLRRYLNFVEGLVVSLDAALGDELGEKNANLGYSAGSLYDPGSRVRFRNQRERLNYYHAYLRTTYFALEGYHRDRVIESMFKLHPELSGDLMDHATQRALRLDTLFIELTNPVWQEKNYKTVAKRLTPTKKERTLEIQADPVQFLEPYVWAEKIFQKLL